MSIVVGYFAWAFWITSFLSDSFYFPPDVGSSPIVSKEFSVKIIKLHIFHCEIKQLGKTDSSSYGVGPE